jgi:ATP-dependent protease ClpP protease subunit
MTEPTKEYDFVRVQGCDVFFYCDVSEESVSELCTAVKKLETTQLGLGVDCPAVTVHILSNGGEVYSGLTCMDYFASLGRTYITTIAEGLCASAATFIFLGGDRRIVAPNAYILIHQIGSEFWGKFDQMKDEMHHCEQLMRHLKKVYLRKTLLPEKKLDRLFKRDIYLPYKKCLKYGLTLAV